VVNWTHPKGMLPNLKPVVYVFYNVYNYSKITNWTVVSCCSQLFGSPTSPNFHAFLAHGSDAVRCGPMWSDAVRCGPMRSDAVISHTLQHCGTTVRHCDKCTRLPAASTIREHEWHAARVYEAKLRNTMDTHMFSCKIPYMKYDTNIPRKQYRSLLFEREATTSIVKYLGHLAVARVSLCVLA